MGGGGGGGAGSAPDLHRYYYVLTAIVEHNIIIVDQSLKLKPLTHTLQAEYASYVCRVLTNTSIHCVVT